MCPVLLLAVHVLMDGPRVDAQSVLVPLTNSLYVRGDIPKTDQVMVDIGTGYLLQKVACPFAPSRRRQVPGC
ncbi:hypothetical protein IMZ48_05650 [Candidatus Bathyarchaeota archaeon]|nr:hypothetical protein [Candidatus Bathyarchaeota archaeon]